MTSRTTERFRKTLAALPAEIQEKAHEAYQLSPRFVSSEPAIQAGTSLQAYLLGMRITRDYRALAVGNVEGDEDLVWFWIGNHAEYDRLSRQL